MCLGLVGYLIADAGCQHKSSAISKLSHQLAFQAEENMAFAAPVIRRIARSVLDQSNTYPAKIAGAPVGDSRLTGVFDGFNLLPVGGAKRDVRHVHGNELLVSEAKEKRDQLQRRLG